MRTLLRSRQTLLIMVIVAVAELSLAGWADRAFKVSHDTYLRAVPVAVPIQVVLVAILLYTVSSEFQEMERLASRPMRTHQAAIWAGQGFIVFGSLVLACLLIGDSGNIGMFAPIKALAGLWGIGLLASSLVDRRIAGVVPVIAVVLPFVLDPNRVPGVALWGFVVEPTDSLAAWLTALGLLVLGLLAHTAFSEGHQR